MKKKILSFKERIYAVLLFMLVVTACYEFDFVNQPYTADPNSFFDVQISVLIEEGTSGDGVFGIMLPIGWTTTDTVEYLITPVNDTGLIIYSENLTQEMTSIDPPPENYYWWVGDSYIENDYDVIIDFKIYTDSQTGNFFLDYMLGEVGNLNSKRSNDHLVIIGDVVGCLPEGITFTTHEEIDSFQINYPNCTEIAGNITISGENITNLNGLDVVTSIGGSLWINNNDSLTSLTGMDNLTSIGGTLSIIGYYPLNSLSGLDNLTTINRSLIIGCYDEDIGVGNLSLSSLAGLENLTTIGGNLSISGNWVLTSLTGLNNVISIGEDFNVNNNALTNLTGLNNVISIGEDLEIYDNNALACLTGLENVTTISGYLKINNNDAQTSLTGLENIDAGSITNLYIQGNASLSTCEVQSICNYLVSPNGTFGINNNASGCNSPQEVHYACMALHCLPNGITFTSQAQIDDFHANYPTCIEVDGDVEIHGNDITNLNGLNVLTAIWGNLSIGISSPGNPALTSLTGLDNVTYIGGNLLIWDNDVLTNLTGLEGLDSIENEFRILDNDALINLEGMEGLTSIGDFEIHYNNALMSLTGLDGLTSTESLSIMGNDALTSLTGLGNIDGGSINGLYIYTNLALSSCSVQSICVCLASATADIVIYDNSPGCNSIEEVDSLCNITDVREFNTKNGVMIFPNPAKNEVSISVKGGKIIKEVNIYNQIGQRVIHKKQITHTIDVSMLRHGMYIIEIEIDNVKYRSKLMIE